QGIHLYADNPIAKKSGTKHAFFFTDRKLYRPGQTIYFKGILLQSAQDGRKNTVRANASTTVSFYDANYQKIDSLVLTSNEYGSVSGKFTAPETGLTGLMTIGNQTNNVQLQVEEYKRPKFYIDFDTLAGDFALDAEVHISGTAKAYAGNNIDEAQVKYRVVRRARFPFMWCFFK